jgi:hypothetical protein
MAIAGACDMMVSVANDSVPAVEDATVKILGLGKRWGAMYSGSPTFAIDTVSRAAALLSMMDPNRPIPESMPEMRRVMKAAYLAEMKQQIDETILARYGLKYAEFRKSGRKQYGDVEFGIMNKIVREYTPSTSFLVCGIDNQGFPHIFTIHSPNGMTVVHDAVGYAAIGTGAQMALGSLGSRKFSGLGIRNVLYRVCEAKFAAETARGVGRSTLLACWRNGFDHIAWGVQTEDLKKIWERLRKQPAPSDAIDQINAAFANTGPFVGLGGSTNKFG